MSKFYMFSQRTCDHSDGAKSISNTDLASKQEKNHLN